MNYWFENSDFTIHVAKSGNDANDGKSFANAKLTIGAAVTAVPDGGMIIVWPGTYSESVDIETAAKRITLIGTHKYKSKITNSSTTVKLYHECVLQNLFLEHTGTGNEFAVDAYPSVKGENIKLIDCHIISSGADAVYAAYAYNLFVKGCFIQCDNDGLAAGEETLIEDSIIVTTGLKGGIGSAARAIVIDASFTARAIIRNSIIIAQPSFRKGATLYECTRNLWCIKFVTGDRVEVVLQNCALIADGYKPAGANAGSYAEDDSYCIENITQLSADNTIFFARTDQNYNKTAYGLKDTNAQIINGNIQIEGRAASYDFDAASTKTIYLANTKYNSNQIGSNITLNTVPDADGGVDAAGKALTAAKLLVNKAVQNKATGVIEYYDDDGQTVILTHTPTDGESAITRTPG